MWNIKDKNLPIIFWIFSVLCLGECSFLYQNAVKLKRQVLRLIRNTYIYSIEFIFQTIYQIKMCTSYYYPHIFTQPFCKKVTQVFWNKCWYNQWLLNSQTEIFPRDMIWEIAWIILRLPKICFHTTILYSNKRKNIYISKMIRSVYIGQYYRWEILRPTEPIFMQLTKLFQYITILMLSSVIL